MSPSIQRSEPSKICGRQPLKNWKGMVYLSRPYPFKFFKRRLSQILLGPLLNTFTLMFNGSFNY